MAWIAGIAAYVAVAAAFYHYIATAAQPDPEEQYLSAGFCWAEEMQRAA